jgi:hypothetical protein
MSSRVQFGKLASAAFSIKFAAEEAANQTKIQQNEVQLAVSFCWLSERSPLDLILTPMTRAYLRTYPNFVT